MGPALGETKFLSMQDAVLETLLKNDDLKLADVEISISKGSLQATGAALIPFSRQVHQRQKTKPPRLVKQRG